MNEESSEHDNPVRIELVHALESDESALGDVFRRLNDGETAEQIAAARGNEHSNFVWNYKRTIDAILGNEGLPTAPTVAMACVRGLRRLVKHNNLSPTTLEHVEQQIALLDAVVANPEARAKEERLARDKTAKVENDAVAGIYVYALPHYLHFRFDEESGHTLFKVGRSDRDAIRRFREQTRTTALPEDPVLLRVYPVGDGDSAEVERAFHETLEDADHDRSTARTGGREWFMTSVRFLDRVAKLLKLEVVEVSDMAD